MEKFAIGLFLGGLCGAVLTANNYKMRSLVRKGQQEVTRRVNDFVDDKLETMEEAIMPEQPAQEQQTKTKATKKRAKK